MDIQIRSAEEKDYEKAEQLMQQVQNRHVVMRPDIYCPTVSVLEKDQFLEAIKDGGAFVAELEEAVVALVLLMVREIKSHVQVNRRVIYIDTMVVEEAYRRRGIGNKLFSYIKTLAEDGSFDGIELQVNARNHEARAMYEKYGFTEKSINMELLKK